jgi:hypothetical protein
VVSSVIKVVSNSRNTLTLDFYGTEKIIPLDSDYIVNLDVEYNYCLLLSGDDIPNEFNEKRIVSITEKEEYSVVIPIKELPLEPTSENKTISHSFKDKILISRNTINIVEQTERLLGITEKNLEITTNIINTLKSIVSDVLNTYNTNFSQAIAPDTAEGLLVSSSSSTSSFVSTAISNIEQYNQDITENTNNFKEIKESIIKFYTGE